MIKIPNLEDSGEKKAFDELIERWVNDDDAVHSKYVAEWDNIDDRLRSDIVVSGFTQKYTDKLADRNNPKTADEAKREKWFVPLNRAAPNHEAVLGDFLSLRRKLLIQGRTPKDRKLARIFKARIEYIEDSEMLPEMVYFPLMDNAFAKGLHWIKCRYNPQKRNLKGKFEISTVNCRDVLVDCRTRGPFFETKRRFIHRFQLPIDEAKEKFKVFPTFVPESLGSDTDYDKAYARTEYSSDEMATFYEVHFQQTQIHFYGLNPLSGEAEEISEQDYEQQLANPVTAKMAFEGDEETKYYAAVYNRHTGTFAVQDNPFGMDVLIPLVNIERDGRLYPIGDVALYANLLDLLDVLVTILVDNMKRQNKPIGFGDERDLAEYQAQIETALEKGGYAPGLKGVTWPQGMNVALMQLIPWVLGWIQDTTSKHAVSMGELPSKQIAKETVETLIAKDRQAHGRKDVTIAYTLTMLAKLMVKMISIFETEPDWFPLLDAKPGTPEYIPVNQRWTEIEYLAKLQEMYEIPTAQTEEESIAFAQKMREIRKRFEDENDIDIEMTEGYVIQSLPQGAQEFTAEQLQQFIANSGLTEEEVFLRYQPVEAPIKVYLVNQLSKDVDLDLRYSIDTDWQNDPKFKANRALLLNSKQMMSRLDTLRELGLPNPEELIENADNENQAIQLAKQIVSNPQLQAALRTVLQAQQQQKGAPAQKPPEAQENR